MKKQKEKKLTKKLKIGKNIARDEKKELVGKNNSYGITLIALVITVIVLLILAGISISMLSGDNSILSRAGQARDKTKETQKDEEVKVAVLGSYDDRANLDIDKLLSNLNKIKDITVTPTQENGTNTFPVTVETEYTTYEITSDGNFEEVVIADRTGINVGDYVNYTPKTASTTYSKDYLGETYTGGTSNTSDLTQETLKWRVLTKYPDGKLDLIADPTSAKVYFKGATGYNNGVYIMHDICEKLYSNTDHNITARSVSLEDFENNMTDVGKIARDEYNKDSTITPQYGHTNYEKWGRAYTYRYYPNIYASENGSGIDTETGAVKTDGIIDTAKGSLDLSIGSSAYKQASTELTAKQTYYSIALNSTNYGDASKVLLKGNTYWVASRYVNCELNKAIFGLSGAKDCIIYGRDMLGSDKTTYNGIRNELRPLVQLGSDIDIIPSTTASSETGTPHTINW